MAKGPDIVCVGDEIEGAKVRGQSRDPLERIDPVLRGETVINRWKASFDVRAQVQSALGDDVKEADRICKDAIIYTDQELLCKDALISSKARKYSSELNHGSSSHKATHWAFAKQTCVQVLTAHEEMLAAQRKRELEQAKKA